MQRNLDSGSELRHHPIPVQWNDPHFAIREILRQKPAIDSEGVIGIRNRQIDFLDADLQRIAGLSLIDVDWPVQNVAAGALVCDFLINVAQILATVLGVAFNVYF